MWKLVVKRKSYLGWRKTKKEKDEALGMLCWYFLLFFHSTVFSFPVKFLFFVVVNVNRSAYLSLEISPSVFLLSFPSAIFRAVLLLFRVILICIPHLASCFSGVTSLCLFQRWQLLFLPRVGIFSDLSLAPFCSDN